MILSEDLPPAGEDCVANCEALLGCVGQICDTEIATSGCPDACEAGDVGAVACADVQAYVEDEAGGVETYCEPLTAEFVGTYEDACRSPAGAGVCLVTGDCELGGGDTVAGSCPDFVAEILCCLQYACTVDDGREGTCMGTRHCDAASGYREAGHCPGSNEIVCCVP